MQKKSFPRPRKRKIDQKKINKFLKTIDFQPTKIFQEWRHLLAFGKYQGKLAVFKLASTQKTSRYTQNEYHWNEAVNAVSAEYRQHFAVPVNYALGAWQKLFWFIAEQFPDKPLIEKNSSDTRVIEKKLPQIARATREINTLPLPKSFEFSKQRNTEQTVGEKLFHSASYWADHTPKDLSDFLQIIAKRTTNLQTCVNHGDFVPRQLYNLGTKIGLIDGEHAGAFGPLYYDVAQFYIRLRNDHNAPQLAHQYLKLYQALLPKADQALFWTELKPVLCQRYIGDLWGDSLHKRKDPKKMSLLYQLGEEILHNQIV
jgi:hypothetical protein